jgi:hypothetical protein
MTAPYIRNARAIWVTIMMVHFLSASASADPIKFSASAGLGDFEFATTGNGKPGEWSIVKNETAQVLAQVGPDRTDNRFPLAVYRSFSGRDVDVTIRFMPVSGSVDQAGGVVIRLTSPDDNYIARANALENNVRFYRVVAGRREMIAGADTPVLARAWHTLRIVANGSRFAISFDGNELFTATDGTFPGAGKAGLWTKADSITWFESIDIKSLD